MNETHTHTPTGDTAVICIGRAQRRIKQGARVARQRRHAQTGYPGRKPRATVLNAIVHRRKLPAAVTQSEERWYMPGLDRHWSADETCNAFGVAQQSTLRYALTGRAPIHAALSDTQACSMLGSMCMNSAGMLSCRISAEGPKSGVPGAHTTTVLATLSSFTLISPHGDFGVVLIVAVSCAADM